MFRIILNEVDLGRAENIICSHRHCTLANVTWDKPLKTYPPQGTTINLYGGQVMYWEEKGGEPR